MTLTYKYIKTVYNGTKRPAASLFELDVHTEYFRNTVIVLVWQSNKELWRFYFRKVCMLVSMLFSSVQDGACQTSEILANEAETQATYKQDVMVSSNNFICIEWRVE